MGTLLVRVKNPQATLTSQPAHSWTAGVTPPTESLGLPLEMRNLGDLSFITQDFGTGHAHAPA